MPRRWPKEIHRQSVQRFGQSNAEMSGDHGDAVAEALGDAGEPELLSASAS